MKRTAIVLLLELLLLSACANAPQIRKGQPLKTSGAAVYPDLATIGVTGDQFAAAIDERFEGAIPTSVASINTNFAQLPPELDGQHIYCKDCLPTIPCTPGGTGAIAIGINGQWACTSGMPQFISNYSQGSGTALTPSSAGNIFLQLPSNVPTSIYCRTIATVRVTNDSSSSPASVTWTIGVSNPVPGTLGSNCPQFPYLGVAHPTTVDTLNLLASQKGTIVTSRDDFLNTDNFCGAQPSGPPFVLSLGTNGTSVPLLNPQIINTSGAGINIDWNAMVTYQCLPALTCNTHNCQPVF